VFNVYEKIRSTPDFYRQLRCGDSLITLFHSLLENKYEDTWSQFNYIVYVVEGRKIWHTSQGSYDLKKGDCVFVRKGACIVVQFFETAPCFIFFFISAFSLIKKYIKRLTTTTAINKMNHLVVLLICLDITRALPALHDGFHVTQQAPPSPCHGDFDCGVGELHSRCIPGVWTCDRIYDCSTGAVRFTKVMVLAKLHLAFRTNLVATLCISAILATLCAPMVTAIFLTSVVMESTIVLMATTNLVVPPQHKQNQ
jgi:hypothetical protein